VPLLLHAALHGLPEVGGSTAQRMGDADAGGDVTHPSHPVRHARYPNQYRAMFVMNCTVKTHTTVQSPDPPDAEASHEGPAEGE
jgi:hypothetical protein